MKVNRQKFLLHLERLLCGGQVPEVVFRDAFAANALTPDQMLMVVAPSIPTAEPLSEEIGVADLGKMIKQVKLNQGEGNLGVEVNLYVDSDDQRLVIDDKDRGVQRLIIASPRTIATRIEQETVDELLSDAPAGKSVPLTRSIVEGVRNAFSLLKAEEVRLEVGPKGSKIIVGSERTDVAEYALEYKSKEAYSLLFGKHLISVFSVISDYSKASFTLGGPDNAILVQDGDYKYLLSPRVRSDDEKPAVKESEESSEGGKKASEKKQSPRQRARAAVNNHSEE